MGGTMEELSVGFLVLRGDVCIRIKWEKASYPELDPVETGTALAQRLSPTSTEAPGRCNRPERQGYELRHRFRQREVPVEQTREISSRLRRFSGRLYLEFGGKLMSIFTRESAPVTIPTSRSGCCRNSGSRWRSSSASTPGTSRKGRSGAISASATTPTP